MSDNNKTPESENVSNIIKPKHINKKQPLDLERSKSAPIEKFDEVTGGDDYISSYNYFIYYNSIEPKDPRLPKPTYQPKPNMEFLKEGLKQGLNKVEEVDEYKEEITQEKEKPVENMAAEMNSMNLQDNSNIQMAKPYKGNSNDNKNKSGNSIVDNYKEEEMKNSNYNITEQIGNNPLDRGYYSPPKNFPEINPQQNFGMFPTSRLYPYNFSYSFDCPHYPHYVIPGQRPQEPNNFMSRNYIMQNPMYKMPFPFAGCMGYPNYSNMNELNYKFYPKKDKKMDNGIKKEGDEQPNIEEIIEGAVQMSKDHSGSRLVQQAYEKGSEKERNRIFEKLKPEILNLSKDIFGNYAIQKILETKDEKKNNYIMDCLKGKILELSTHMYGCRVMQQLISVIDEKFLPDISYELKMHFESLIEDQNGNHVIQKLIERSKQGENIDIFEIVYKNISKLSKHQYGCRVIQTLLKKCSQEQINKLFTILYNLVVELSKDQYGNYIIQYILDNKNGYGANPIYEKLKGNIYEFSLHKYASNVVEKALSCGTEEQRKNIINEIIKQDDNSKETLLSMVKDKFGNYVVQQIIEYSDQNFKENIINRIISSQSLGKKNGFSKHVINFIEKLQADGTVNLNNLNRNEKNENDKKGKTKK
jgi:hypothetical protein